ncbi:UNVERIFIED_ORG: AcrR family transcriptional regulator/DNA-binding MarR family transcriptional regulator [Pseudomonas lini]|uniref:TetR family transcriptional regulator n=2 Tax=Pseudomonas viciae TaxID=2505979 RepID=A0ABY8P6I6_9PSED|nr:MarR family transcriptional regulator [Pseudomonas viciae]UZE84143.1 TetR family transcriptional regulator [Pseudomonas viciae]WGO91054.1 TetR family transcriptional regulator [Pseudomonas viciae]
MRHPPSQTAERREKILEEASRLFRGKGIAGASIAEVMKASGLTHGAFYAHFDSKDALVCASLERAMDQLALELRETVSGSDAPKEAFLGRYLSQRHRDHPEAGCAMPALAIDVSREPGMRRSFTSRVVGMIELLTSSLPWRRGRSREDQAIGFLAAIVGAMVLARAVDEPQLSDRILRATRDELLDVDKPSGWAATDAPQHKQSDSILTSVLDNIEQQKQVPAHGAAASGEVGEQLSFALYGAANRMIRLHKPLLEPLGLTFPQYLVMLELFTEAPRTVGDLGTKLAMDTGTITPLLKRLEASGMVTRTRDRGDERRVLIALTDAALALSKELLAVTDKINTACQLDDDGQEALRDTLNAFARPAGE